MKKCIFNKIKLYNKEKNTYPICIHFSGSSKKNSDKIVIDNVLNNKSIWIQEEDLDKDFFIVLPSNNEKHILCKQLMKNNIPFNMSCIKIDGEWKHIYKITETLKVLKSIPQKYCFISDASDVVLLEHPNVILKKFIEMQKEDKRLKALYNAEINSYPRSLKEEAKFERETYKESIFCHLNAGAAIGETEFFIEIFEKASKLDVSYGKLNCDQSKFRKIHMDNYPIIQIDKDCKIFQCMYKTQGGKIIDIL